jgi:biotin transport system substrate-specific component
MTALESVPVVPLSSSPAVARSFAREALLAATAVVLLALAAQVRVMTPFSSVPFTLQTMVVLGIGLTLGAAGAAAALAGYLTLGLLGLPVFTGFVGGPAVFAGHTAGYLLGFALAAPLVAWLLPAGWRSPMPRLAAVLALAQVVIYSCGVLWLVAAIGLTSQAAWIAGVVPFIGWEAVKIALLMAAVPAFDRAVRLTRGQE